MVWVSLIYFKPYFAFGYDLMWTSKESWNKQMWLLSRDVKECHSDLYTLKTQIAELY